MMLQTLKGYKVVYKYINGIMNHTHGSTKNSLSGKQTMKMFH